MNPSPSRSAERARRFLRKVSWLVPAHARTAWLEEWTAEVEALVDVRATAPAADLPTVKEFVWGALPHAMWMRKEEWTMNGVMQDVRYAVRVLARSPGFTLVAALTLALGIGANATILSLVNGLLLRTPGGVEEPHRLMQVARSYDDDPRWDNWSWPALETIRADGTVFQDVAGFSQRSFVIGEGMEAEQVMGLLVTGNFFSLLGARAEVGRLLGPDDDRTPGGHPVAVLGHGLWTTRYGGDPGVVGRNVSVGGTGYEIVGVAGRGFHGVRTMASPPQLFVPASMYPPFRGELPFEAWGWSWIDGVARLADGVSPARARAAMEVVTARLRAAAPVNENIRVLVAEGAGLTPAEAEQARLFSVLLLGVAGLVLLLTCANVANLFIARASTRIGEMGVRLALGAGRRRLARQLVTESVVLGLLAAVAAAPLLVAGSAALPSFLPYPVAVSLAPDVRVYGALAGLGVVAGLLFGAMPSILVARRDVAGSLRRSGTAGRTDRGGVRNALVVGQLALSLALLSGAALLATSLHRAANAEPGFRPAGVLVAAMNVGATGRYDPAEAASLGEELARRASALPGVEAASVGTMAPFVGGFARATRAPADHPNPESVEVEGENVFVGPDYFRALGIPLTRGRPFRRSADEPEGVAVVNEALARRFWPGDDPIGKYLAGEVPLRVVGVVGNTQHRGLRAEVRPGVFEPLHQNLRTGYLFLTLRTTGDPLARADDVRRLAADVDPGLPVVSIVDLRERMAGSLGETRTVGILVGLFALLALILSAVGLYGLMSFSVASRTRELGVRLALGAAPGALVGLVMRHGARLALAGAVVGAILALGAGRALGSFLYEVDASDPLPLTVAALILTVTAMAAAWMPARRVTRVSPVESLKE